MQRPFFLICCGTLCCLPLVSAVRAQDLRASWSNLKQLQSGQQIEIVEMNAEKHTGTFVEFSDADIAIWENSRPHIQVITLTNVERIAKANVRSVILKENKHRLRNTAIGLVAGGVAGLGLGIAATVNDPANSSGAVFGGMSVGALMGAWIGHLIPGRHAKIYEATTASTQPPLQQNPR